MATLSEMRDDILSKPIHWIDKSGITHACTGDYLTPEDFCLWTKCEKHDVPADAGYRPGDGDKVTCKNCLRKAEMMKLSDAYEIKTLVAAYRANNK